MARERIGIMGGTLDPVHMGHIRMALTALREAELDRVLMLPSGNPPHKPGVTPAEDRWRMLTTACTALDEEEGARLEPSRAEIDRTGTIYTVDTLSILKEKYPKADLFYIIGTDTLMELKNWREYGRVLKSCTFCICPRESKYTPEQLETEKQRLTLLGGRFMLLEMDMADVSSTELRQAIREDSPAPLLPEQLRAYSRLRGLYGVTPGMAEFPEWTARLYDALSRKRFAHTMGVVHTARQLALIHGEDPVRAEAAALLHDCAKCLPLKTQQQLARGHGLTDDAAILESGALLHSTVGAWTARTEYGVTDEAILSAIAAHTTGKPGMSRLDMIVWLADTIEPGRESYPLLSETRTLAKCSLERAMLHSLEGTAAYVRRRGHYLHPTTLETIAWLRDILK